VAVILFQKLVCDARIGDQRRDEAGAKYHADSACSVHSAGDGDNLRDTAKLLTGDADEALAQWWRDDFCITAKQDSAGIGANAGIEKLTEFL